MKSRKFNREKIESDLLQRLLRAERGGPETVPPNFLTSSQWAKKWNLSYSRAIMLIREGLTAGVMECKVFRIPNGGRSILPTRHYAEVEP